MSKLPEIAKDPMYAATWPKDGLGGLFAKIGGRWYHVYFMGMHLRFQEVK